MSRWKLSSRRGTCLSTYKSVNFFNQENSLIPRLKLLVCLQESEFVVLILISCCSKCCLIVDCQRSMQASPFTCKAFRCQVHRLAFHLFTEAWSRNWKWARIRLNFIVTIYNLHSHLTLFSKMCLRDVLLRRDWLVQRPVYGIQELLLLGHICWR